MTRREKTLEKLLFAGMEAADKLPRGPFRFIAFILGIFWTLLWMFPFLILVVLPDVIPFVPEMFRDVLGEMWGRRPVKPSLPADRTKE